ncbi:MAG: GAF domain-containing protein [Pleurocapsa sp. MO_192.B19]|nr:GAF domain-containing protein [Pleurocapsa sp. MO_192.B19]
MTQALFSKLSNDQNLEKLLKITVETIRKTLKCDRVIIYNARELPKATVLAESVVAEYSSITGQTIKDPFLVGEYLEMYCYGQTVIIDNIDTADQYPSDLEDLKKLGIKSLAIAPILNRNQLLALLVVHQCSKFQHWQPETVDFLTKKASQMEFAISNIVNAEKLNAEKLNAEKLNDSNGTKQTTEIYQHQNSPAIKPTEANNQYEYLQPRQQKAIIQQDINLLFMNVHKKIASEEGQENILNTTVEEIRNLLNCDRVLIYSLNPDNYGVVVAESVAPAWTKTLGRTIDDPCFANRYLEKYRHGRVHAWDNIEYENTTPCYLEQLQSLGAIAGLVVPIVNEGQIFGLLIAHQCSDTRHWQEREIDWMREIAHQVAIMLEYNQIFVDHNPEKQQLADTQLPLQQQMEEESMWTEYFTDAIQQIRQSLKTEDILKTSVREVRRILTCDRVVIYSLNQANYGIISAESVASGWTKALGRIIKDPCFEAKYLEQYRNGRVRAWSNIYEAGMSNCYVEQLEQLEVKANLVTPIINEGKLFGLLVAHQCSDPRQWQQSEILWVSQIATQVGFALDNAQLLEQLEEYINGTHEILDRAINNISNIQRTVQNIAVEFDSSSHFCQQFSETINTIVNLSKQIAQQSMSIIRIVNLGQIEERNQNSIIDVSDTIFSLIQQLFEVTARFEFLFTDIKTGVTEKTTALKSKTQQLSSGIAEFQVAHQNLDQVVALNNKMSTLIENISHSGENQTQSSTIAKDSIQELANIAKRISEQSIAITQSFSQLIVLVQKL